MAWQEITAFPPLLSRVKTPDPFIRPVVLPQSDEAVLVHNVSLDGGESLSNLDWGVPARSVAAGPPAYSLFRFNSLVFPTNLQSNGGLAPDQLFALQATGEVDATMGQFNPNALRALTANTKVEYSVQWNGETGEGVVTRGSADEVQGVPGYAFVVHTHNEGVPTGASMGYDLDNLVDNQPELVVGLRENKLILRQPANPPYFPEPRITIVDSPAPHKSAFSEGIPGGASYDNLGPALHTTATEAFGNAALVGVGAGASFLQFRSLGSGDPEKEAQDCRMNPFVWPLALRYHFGDDPMPLTHATNMMNRNVALIQAIHDDYFEFARFVYATGAEHGPLVEETVRVYADSEVQLFAMHNAPGLTKEQRDRFLAERSGLFGNQAADPVTLFNKYQKYIRPGGTLR